MENDNKCFVDNTSYLLDYECKYNCRDKYYINSQGELIHLETMVCKRFIFNPDNVTVHNGERLRAKEKWNKILDEMYGYSGNVELLCKESSTDRSKRRAKKKMYDYIICNDFDLFCTLTINPELIDNRNYNAVIKKLNIFLDNRVRRNELKYVGVPELHKKGGLHFHFLCNSEAVKLIDSGVVSVKGYKKPIKISTADKYKIPNEDRKTVYNIADWTLGFTTAIKTYGDVQAVANYVGKYISKGENKIGGRWYYSGGQLNTPIYKYSRVSYSDVQDFTYDFKCDGGEFKVKDHTRKEEN